MGDQSTIQIDKQVGNLLKRNSLSITDSRKKILQLFLEQAGALAHGDIEKKAGEKFDRVTVYRTLQVFVDKGIIHTIPTADNSIRYALCKMIAPKVTIMITTSILYAMFAAIRIALMMW
jgi:Fur family ferric uptake transcriptional regulator